MLEPNGLQLVGLQSVEINVKHVETMTAAGLNSQH